MSVRLKLMVIILFVGLVPLTIGSLAAQRIHQRSFDRKITELHLRLAESGAALVQREVDHTARTVLLASQSIQWDRLTPAERQGALALIFRQLDAISVVALLDRRGEGIGASMYVAHGDVQPELANHPAMSLEGLQAFAQVMPFAEAGAQGKAIGSLFAVPESNTPMLPLAFRLVGKRQAEWVLAVAISLDGACRELNRLSGGSVNVYALDANGNSFCLPERGLSAADSHLLRLPGDQKVSRYLDEAGTEMLAGQVPIKLGWRVVAEQPVKLAFASSRRMLLQTVFLLILSLVAAVAAGLFLAQTIERPVNRLVEGAKQLAAGAFDYRLPAKGNDEFGRLSRTFNQMGEEIQARNQELSAFNRELQSRVDERTKELRDAQEQLLESKKMAAVTSLGAGFAHELNNPLTSVLGLAQVLESRLRKQDQIKEATIAQQMVEQGLRMKEIVGTLSSLAESYVGESTETLDLHNVVELAVKLVEDEFTEISIPIVRELGKDVPTVVGNGQQLQEVLSNLFSNSRAAIGDEGGTITVTTSSVGGAAVKLIVRDTGRGIAQENLQKVFEPFFTTKADWQGAGLGLSVAYRIIEQHRGKIEAASEIGTGTTFTITLPAATRRSHLI